MNPKLRTSRPSSSPEKPLDDDLTRFDPDDVVEAIHARHFRKRTELERVVLHKPGCAPIIVHLAFPLLEKQVRIYLETAGFTPSEISHFVSRHARAPGAFRGDPPKR